MARLCGTVDKSEWINLDKANAKTKYNGKKLEVENDKILDAYRLPNEDDYVYACKMYRKVKGRVTRRWVQENVIVYYGIMMNCSVTTPLTISLCIPFVNITRIGRVGSSSKQKIALEYKDVNNTLTVIMLKSISMNADDWIKKVQNLKKLFMSSTKGDLMDLVERKVASNLVNNLCSKIIKAGSKGIALKVFNMLQMKTRYAMEIGFMRIKQYAYSDKYKNIEKTVENEKKKVWSLLETERKNIVKKTEMDMISNNMYTAIAKLDLIFKRSFQYRLHLFRTYVLTISIKKEIHMYTDVMADAIVAHETNRACYVISLRRSSMKKALVKPLYRILSDVFKTLQLRAYSVIGLKIARQNAVREWLRHYFAIRMNAARKCICIWANETKRWSRIMELFTDCYNDMVTNFIKRGLNKWLLYSLITRKTHYQICKILESAYQRCETRKIQTTLNHWRHVVSIMQKEDLLKSKTNVLVAYDVVVNSMKRVPIERGLYVVCIIYRHMQIRRLRLAFNKVNRISRGQTVYLNRFIRGLDKLRSVYFRRMSVVKSDLQIYGYCSKQSLMNQFIKMTNAARILDHLVIKELGTCLMIWNRNIQLIKKYERKTKKSTLRGGKSLNALLIDIYKKLRIKHINWAFHRLIRHAEETAIMRSMTRYLLLHNFVMLMEMHIKMKLSVGFHLLVGVGNKNDAEQELTNDVKQLHALDSNLGFKTFTGSEDVMYSPSMRRNMNYARKYLKKQKSKSRCMDFDEEFIPYKILDERILGRDDSGGNFDDGESEMSYKIDTKAKNFILEYMKQSDIIDKDYFVVPRIVVDTPVMMPNNNMTSKTTVRRCIDTSSSDVSSNKDTGPIKKPPRHKPAPEVQGFGLRNNEFRVPKQMRDNTINESYRCQNGLEGDGIIIDSKFISDIGEKVEMEESEDILGIFGGLSIQQKGQIQ